MDYIVVRELWTPSLREAKLRVLGQLQLSASPQRSFAQPSTSRTLALTQLPRCIVPA